MSLNRSRRLAIALIGVPVLLVAIAAVALPFFIDVERYRPWIAEKAQEATGRSVSMGEISLRLFPAPALTVDSVAISEGSRLPDADALRMRRLSVRLGILGLIRGRPVIQSLILDQPVLVLHRDERGRWNYDDLLHRAQGADQSGGPQPSAAAGTPTKKAATTAVRATQPRLAMASHPQTVPVRA